jgi:hypothetical protein
VREIEFSQADELEQRHKALGLIIAAYVVANTRSAPEPEPVASPSPEPAPEPRELAPSPRRFAIWNGDIGLTAGPGLDRGEPRFGLMLRGVVRPIDIALGGLLSLRAARRFNDDNPVLWVSGSAGLALLLQAPASPLAVETRLEAIAQRMHTQAQDPISGERDEGGVWRFGGQLGLELQLRLASSIFLFAGADLEMLLPAVHLAVAGRSAGVEKPFAWGGLAGLRVAR